MGLINNRGAARAKLEIVVPDGLPRDAEPPTFVV